MRVRILGLGMAALLLARLAQAYPGCEPLFLLGASTFPANGVFVVGSTRTPVTADHGISISVEGPGGPVSGSLELVNAVLVFRPDAELEVGSYSVSVFPMPGTVICAAQPVFAVQVTEPVTIDPPDVACSLRLAATLGAGSSEVCCGLLPDSWDTAPYCFATTANTNHVGLAAVSCQFDLHGASLGQLLCRLVDAPVCEWGAVPGLPGIVCPHVTDAPSSGEDLALPWSAPSDSVPALIEANEYCVHLECLDTRTGIPFSSRQCEPDPDLEPVEVDILEFDVADLVIGNGCEIPPAGFEPAWCDINRSYFEEQCAVYSSTDRWVASRCAEYERRCRAAKGEVHGEPGCGCHTTRTPRAVNGAWLGLCALASFRRRRGRS